MYRALIVDDEPAMIEGLKLLVPWDSSGFTLCGEASSAQEALTKLSVLRPHLVITDIRMPLDGENAYPGEIGLKDGIDLIEKTRELGIYTEFVILSGYPNFDYAQRAIRHKVKRYLLKPLDKDEIIEALACTKKHLDEQFLAHYGLTGEDIKDFAGKGKAQKEDDTQGGFAGFPVNASSKRELEIHFDSRLANAVELMNLQEALDLVEALFAWIQQPPIPFCKASVLINSSVYMLLRIVFDRNIQINIDTALFFSCEPEHWQWKQVRQALTDIIMEIINLLQEDRRRHTRFYLYQVKADIDQNYQKELSVSQLAKNVYVDPVYLGKAFRNEFGCTISEYQHRLRIKEAESLIKQTDKTFSEISLMVGYNNYNNFFTHFERIIGKKPIKYKADGNYSGN